MRQRPCKVCEAGKHCMWHPKPACEECEVLEAEVGRLQSDAARLDWLGTHLAGSKWDDALESLRPADEKYITGPTMLRAAIDAARASKQGE